MKSLLKIVVVTHIFTACFLLTTQKSFAAVACSTEQVHRLWYFEEKPRGYPISDYIYLTNGTSWGKIQRTISTLKKDWTCEYDPKTQSDEDLISSEPGFLHFYEKGNKQIVLFVHVDEGNLSISKIWVRLKKSENDDDQ